MVALGNVPHVAQESSGWIRFAVTTTSHLLTYGDVLSVEVILGWRDGPSRLRDDDDESTSKNDQQCIRGFPAMLHNVHPCSTLSYNCSLHTAWSDGCYMAGRCWCQLHSTQCKATWPAAAPDTTCKTQQMCGSCVKDVSRTTTNVMTTILFVRLGCNDRPTYICYQLLLELSYLDVCRNRLHENQRWLLHCSPCKNNIIMFTVA